MSPVLRRKRRPHGLDRLRQSRVLRIFLVALGVLVLAAVLWCGWTVRQVYSDLTHAKDEATILRSALARGDVDGARAASEQFGDASTSAADHTDGVTWRALDHVPIVGDDFGGLAVASDVLSDIGDRGLPPLLSSADGLTAGSFAPSDDRFPLPVIASLEGPAQQSHDVFATSARRLQDVDSSGFVPSLRGVFDSLRAQVDTASDALGVAERATRLMPDLLGADGPRNYLLVFQNNAELRATGGLPGALSLVHADDGHVAITKQGAASGFQQLPRPVLPLDAAERDLYGTQLGTYFLDANFSPDFPRAAQLWDARWKKQFGQRLDGVFVVDPVAMSYLLQATGPIQVGAVTLTADNLVQTVENSVYTNVADPQAQDDFFEAVAKAAFDVFANGGGDQVGLVRGLVRGVDEERVLVHSFDPDDQQDIMGTRIAGDLSDHPTSRPQVGVYLNDATGAKMSYFLDYQVDVNSVSCTDGRQKLIGKLQLDSDTPDDIRTLPYSVTGYPVALGDIEPGQQVVVADLFAPVGGSIGDLRVDGKAQQDPLVYPYLGRDVVPVIVKLDPQQSQVVQWTMLTGPDQPGDVHVAVTPGSHPGPESSTAPSTC